MGVSMASAQHWKGERETQLCTEIVLKEHHAVCRQPHHKNVKWTTGTMRL